ncbi:coilin isoform X2 [Pipistrellus kuhlii]|uniref:Coilin n=1 Tax=Pipistrellus kuhlii TaxID=59472 RepID=A0A7J7TKS4_PIPKU|nr:coilin isoform X2 [Pipistrellus kuhlii]KAF6301105.1 coilin [Pipistrellus kuhlii]
MAASETVRLRLRFDYPPPATPHCMDFWLLVDLNRCRVVTDLISLIRQRFGFSSGALLSLYLEGGLLPHGESARLVRDNDCLRKAKKRSLKLEEDEETGDRNSKKHWKRRENNNNENTLDPEPKAVTDHNGRGKNKRKYKAAPDVVDEDDKETKRKSPKKRTYRKRMQNPRSSKAQTVKERTAQKCSPLKGSPARSSLVKTKRKGGVEERKGGVEVPTKDSPSSFSESESCHDSSSELLSNVILEVRKSSEKVSTALSKEGPSVKNTTTNKVATTIAFNSATIEDKTTRASDSSSDSSSDSDDLSDASKSSPEKTAGLLKPGGLLASRGRPGPGPAAQTLNAPGCKNSDSNGGRQPPPGPPGATVPFSLGRGWGRGEDLLSWKGIRGRGMRGRSPGRGRGLAVPLVLNKDAEYEKQQHLNETVTNSSTVIQNPLRTQKDYSLLPLLAAAPQVGEKIAFKLLELTSDYSPDISDYKEGKILSHNPETQQVDIEILSSRHVSSMKEPGKFDLVYHNENGSEVVEYAVTQERKITVFWRQLIDPRLIVESSSNNTSSTELA